MKITNILLSSLLSLSALAADVSDVITKANHVSYYKGQDGRAQVNMLIKDSQGRESKRSFTILRLNEGSGDGEQKFYVFFKRPSDVKNMSFLVWKKMKGDDDRWMYYPSLDLVKRIAGSDKRTSFVGSDYFYEDVSGRRPTDDDHKLVSEDKTYFIIESTPKDVSTVEFSKYKTWIHVASYLPVKTEYYDKNGKTYRTYEALKVENVQGHPTVTSSKMKDLNRGSETVLTYSKVQYDSKLGVDLFTERYLRKPPTKELDF